MRTTTTPTKKTKRAADTIMVNTVGMNMARTITAGMGTADTTTAITATASSGRT
jgi:hypothetical protein